MSTAKAPKGLGPSGRALWNRVVAGLGKDWELDERETLMLGLAARQRDDLSLLEAAIKRDGAMVLGSTGQPVVNPAIAEARQARQAIRTLLGALKLPDDEEVPRTSASQRGQHAANSRWRPEVRRGEARG